MPVTVVIPLKALTAAKGRLAPALSPRRRRALASAMLRHVAATCLASPSVGEVLVVAGDEAGARLARAAGTQVLLVTEPGLTTALERADAHLAGAPATMVVAADLPLLAVEDVEALAAAGGLGRGGVAVAPTRDGGTGGLLRRPGDVIGCAFGPGSAAEHRRLAAEAGIAAQVVVRDGFALDLDTAGQLRALAEVDPRLVAFAS